MGFPQISHAMTDQSRGASERSDFIQIEEIHIVIGKLLIEINTRENRRGKQEWAIQINCQYWVHKTQDKDIQNKKDNREN
jgi:hypothetical protein